MELSLIFTNNLKLYLSLLLVSILGYLKILGINQEVWIIIILFSVVYTYIELKRVYLLLNTKTDYSFRSQKEEFIAKYLISKKIKFIYEKPLKLDNRLLKPDFYLPEYDVYVEYWGLWNINDNDKKSKYKDNRKQKKELYQQYNIRLLELYPDNLSSFNRLDWVFTSRLLELLKTRLI